MMMMEDFKYRNYLIKPGELDDSGFIDAWAQTFEVSRSGKKFYIRLGIANPVRAHDPDTLKEVEEVLRKGAREVIDLLNTEEEKINNWNYFEYDRSGEWVQTDREF